MRLNSPALSAAIISTLVTVLANLVTSLVKPEWIRPWWWVLTALLLVAVYLTVYEFRRRDVTIKRISAGSHEDGGLHLFGVTRGGALMSRQFHQGRLWSPWKPHALPGVRARDVAAVAADDVLDIFVADSAGAVWTHRQGPEGWSRWERLSSDHHLGRVTAVAAMSGWPGHRELYAVGTNGQVAHRWQWEGHPWSPWHAAGRGDTRDVALSTPAKDILECFALGRDGELWHRWFLNDAWSDWASLGRAADRSAGVALSALNGEERHQEVLWWAPPAISLIAGTGRARDGTPGTACPLRIMSSTWPAPSPAGVTTSSSRWGSTPSCGSGSTPGTRSGRRGTRSAEPVVWSGQQAGYRRGEDVVRVVGALCGQQPAQVRAVRPSRSSDRRAERAIP